MTWHVASDGKWTSVAELPGASIESLDKGPGMIWKRQVRVRLAHGTLLMSVDSIPGPAAPKDPLDYLWDQRPRTARQVRRSYFRVGSAGRLVRTERENP